MPPKGVKANQLDERARWIADFRIKNPTLGYRETLDATRRHFVIGKTAAEQAYKTFGMLEDELTEEWRRRGRQKLVAIYNHIMEMAREKGDLTNARKAADSLRVTFGLAEPERVEHSGTVGVRNYDDMTDEEVAAMALIAKIDAAKRTKIEE